MRVSLKYWLIGGLLLATAVYALAEDITLTTYYPSPRGVYQELKTAGNMVVGNITNPPGARLHVVQDDPASAVPVFRADDETAPDTTPFIITSDGDVGIGIETPTQKLEVNGAMRLTPIAAGSSGPAVYASQGAGVLALAGSANGFAFRNQADAANLVRITNAGNVGIGTDTPDPSALLDLSSAIRGFRPPRLTLAERDAIATPAEGLLIFNTTDRLYNYYDGTGWAPLASRASIPNIQAFDTSDFFTVPPGVTEIMVKVWGGGGGGASYTGTAGGGGGGSGGYAEGIFSVTPGDTLTVTVGDGGAGGVGFGASGSAGAASGVGTLISATGGAGGTGGTGGVGGSGSGGHLNINGGRGAPGLYNASGAIAAGAGGTTGAGGGAGGPGDSAGIPGQGGGEAGQFPGGGGGGGISVGPYPGADGAVIILF